MKKVISVMLVAILLMSIVAGCGNNTAQNQENSNQDVEKQDKPHIVYVSPLLAHPIWLIAKQGFEDAAKDLDFRGDWVGPTNIDVNEMIKLIETSIAQKADGIITQGMNPEAMIPALIKADKAGIPYIVVDSDIPQSKRVAYLGKDPKVQAQLIAKAIFEKFGDKKINAAVMVAALDYKVAIDQIAALEEELAKHPAGFSIVRKVESKSDMMKAVSEWQNIFNTYDEVNVAINFAAEAGPAAAKVVDEMGISDDVMVIAVDDMEETLDYIKKGTIDGTIVTSFYKYGYQSALWLYQNIKDGKKPGQVDNDAGTMLVTKDNIDSYDAELKEIKELQ